MSQRTIASWTKASVCEFGDVVIVQSLGQVGSALKSSTNKKERKKINKRYDYSWAEEWEQSTVKEMFSLKLQLKEISGYKCQNIVVKTTKIRAIVQMHIIVNGWIRTKHSSFT